MRPKDGSNRLLGAQDGSGGQLILKYNLLGPCPVGSGPGLAQRTGDAGFEASRYQSLQTPQESWFGVNEGMEKAGSFKLGGMNPLPRFGLGTLLPFRLTGGPGSGGRVCRSPREPRVLGGSWVGMCLGEAPLGRPWAGGQVLRVASRPARGGCGRRAACGHRRRTRLEANPVAANSPAASAFPASSYLHRRTQLVSAHPIVTRKGAMQMTHDASAYPVPGSR